MAIPTVFIVSVAVFALVRLIPGDPASLMLGDAGDAAALEALRERLGLNESIFNQYVIWAGNIFQGDFGRSIANQQPILPMLVDRFAVSAEIVLAAVLLSAIVAVPAGMLAAWRQNSMTDLALVTGATLLLSIPAFWMGLLLLLVFGLQLNWLPIVGYVTFGEDPIKALLYLILPVTTLFLHEIGVILRMMRASTLEVLNQEYITHARAKGLAESTIVFRHAFRNAFGPTWTLLGLILGNLCTRLSGHSGMSAVYRAGLCRGEPGR